MSAQRLSQADWFERIARSLMAIALLAGVAWAVTDGGALPTGLFSR